MVSKLSIFLCLPASNLQGTPLGPKQWQLQGSDLNLPLFPVAWQRPCWLSQRPRPCLLILPPQGCRAPPLKMRWGPGGQMSSLCPFLRPQSLQDVEAALFLEAHLPAFLTSPGLTTGATSFCLLSLAHSSISEPHPGKSLVPFFAQAPPWKDVCSTLSQHQTSCGHPAN